MTKWLSKPTAPGWWVVAERNDAGQVCYSVKQVLKMHMSLMDGLVNTGSLYSGPIAANDEMPPFPPRPERPAQPQQNPERDGVYTSGNKPLVLAK
jgi:hypothetical protein